MTRELELYQQKLATLLHTYRDGPEAVEERLVGELDDLWYSLSQEERVIADNYSRRIARGEVTEEQFFREAFGLMMARFSVGAAQMVPASSHFALDSLAHYHSAASELIQAVWTINSNKPNLQVGHLLVSSAPKKRTFKYAIPTAQSLNSVLELSA